MLNITEHAIKCLQVPYFILFVCICIMFFFVKRKVFFVLFALFLFMFSWRLFFNINSSRYCASFLLVLYLGIALLLKHYPLFPIQKVSIVAIFCGLLLFNSLKLFSAFRDMYQLDLANDVNSILSNESSSIFIQEKEMKRIGVADSFLSTRQMSMSDLPLSYETLTPFYDFYDYIRSDSFFVFSRKNRKNAPQVHIPDNSHSFFREIRHYRSNNKTSYYKVFP